MAALTSEAEGLRLVLEDPDAWSALIESRRAQLAQFLRWAAACEAGDRETSLRLKSRDDLVRCRSVLPLFDESWWGVVVYSCFDSTTGTRIAAPRFHDALPPEIAEGALMELEFPRGSVQHHRAQSTLAGARRSLVSACQKAEQIHDVLFHLETTFDDRFERLMKVNVSWWGRTTCFDALLRAGALGVAGGNVYRPEKAYLLGSQGPAAGFELVWGISVTKETADLCERLLVRWTTEWFQLAAVAGVVWDGESYDSGDFENALCVYQEPANRRVPNPAAFAMSSPSTIGRRKC